MSRLLETKMDTWDIEELAWRALGKTDEETEQAINDGDIDEAIYERYECSFEAYCAIVRDLTRFTPIVVSALTGDRFHAFVDVAQQRTIVKLIANPPGDDDDTR